MTDYSVNGASIVAAACKLGLHRDMQRPDAGLGTAVKVVAIVIGLIPSVVTEIPDVKGIAVKCKVVVMVSVMGVIPTSDRQVTAINL